VEHQVTVRRTQHADHLLKESPQFPLTASGLGARRR
jgi:hypothetical protein